MHLTAYWKAVSIGRRAPQFFKTLRMLKLTALLLVVGCLHVSAHSFGQTVTYSKQQASLEEIFEAIHAQTGYYFYYKSDVLKRSKPVSLSVKDAPLLQVLQVCFVGQPLQYEITNDVIVVTEKAPSTTRDTSWIAVRGRVVNEQGDGIGGATLQVVSIQRMTSTDGSGQFSFQRIPRESVLEVSSVGYVSRTVAVDGSTELVIRLVVADTKLDEVQVVAYGTQSRRFNTGNVSRVSSKELAIQPVSNALAALHGRVPGLVIQQTTGVPGGGISVQLRGQNSLRPNGNDMLYLVDGVPFPSSTLASPFTSVVVQGGNPLSVLNPADIESIEVLKDADATAIYGSRGANGVMLITTKKGSAGKTALDINVYQGWGRLTRTMDMLSRRQYLDMRLEAFKNDGGSPQPYHVDLTQWDTSRYTDWQKELVGGTARFTNAEASFSGGTGGTSWLLSSTYRRETTVFPGDFADQKGSVHLNLSHVSEDKRFHTAVTASYVSDRNNLIYTDLLSTALLLQPVAPALYQPDGALNWERSTWTNPLSHTRGRYLGQTQNLMSNANMSYRLARIATFRVQGGYTSYQLDESNLQPSTSFDPAYNMLGMASFSAARLTTWIVEPQLDLQTSWDQLQVNVLLGATWQQSRRTGQRLEASQYASDAVLDNPAAAGQLALQDVIDNLYRYQALFGRVQFNWQQRYLLNLTGRRDGSTRFGPGNRYGVFGAIGAGWIMSQEKWWKRLPTAFHFAKLRASYGTTGNDQIGEYGYLPLWMFTNNRYDGHPALQPSNLFNPAYQWEINRKLEVGAEFGLFKDRAFVGISYYQNRSSNQLVGYPLPLLTGFPSVQANLDALVENKGWEFEVAGTVVQSEKLRWKVSANASLPRTRLLKFPDLEGSSYRTRYAIGVPLKLVQAFRWVGVDPATGIHQMEDVDKNGQLTFPQDASRLLPVQVRLIAGISNTLEWKGFQVDVFFQGQVQDGYTFERYFTMPGSGSNQPSYVLDRWQQPGDRARYQRFSQLFSGPVYQAYDQYRTYADQTVGDASFVRLKNLSIAYRIPPAHLTALKLKQVQVYLQGQNLLTFTKYRGVDPEAQSFRNIPPLRVWVFGLRLTL